MQAAPLLPAASPLLQRSFVALAVVVALLFVAGAYASALRTGAPRESAMRGAIVTAVVAAAWMTATGLAAAGGLLRFQSPPTMLLLLPVTLAAAIALALSPVGRRFALGLPLAALVSAQSFRIVVELLLHRAYVEGLMPVQMSYSGRNLDIVSGLTAALLGAWLATGRRSLRLVRAWNALGMVLLANILAVALLSTPTPLRVFTNEPANVWIARAPWVWLPTVLVFAALFGHVVVLRRLRVEATGAAPADAAPALAG